mgnify:CR=1 FL=1
MKVKIISGGQTGVDQGALLAAKSSKFETGGAAPRNFMTKLGPARWLSNFGLYDSGLDYAGRTRLNVESSHFTIVFGGQGKVMSPGTKLTMNILAQKNVPHVWLPIDYDSCDEDLQTLFDELERAKLLYDEFVLNIAGPSEENLFGAGALTFKRVQYILAKIQAKLEHCDNT